MAPVSRGFTLKQTADLFGLSLVEAKYIQLRSDIKPIASEEGLGRYDPAHFAKAWADSTSRELAEVRNAPSLTGEQAMDQYGLKATQLERIHHHADLMEVDPSYTRASALMVSHNKVLLREAIERDRRDSQQRPRVADINDWIEDRPLETVPLHNVKLLEKPVIHSPTMRDQFSATLKFEFGGQPKSVEMKVDALTAERLHDTPAGTVLRNMTFQFMGAHHKDDPSLKQSVAVCRFVDLPFDQARTTAPVSRAQHLEAKKPEPRLTGIVKHFEKDNSGLSLVLAYSLPDSEQTLKIHYSEGPEAQRLAESLTRARREGFVSKLSVTVESEKLTRGHNGERLLNDPPFLMTPTLDRMPQVKGISREIKRQGLEH